MKLMKFASQKIKDINIEDIKPNPYQCRRHFNLLKLNSLADSLKKVGILSPLILRATKNGYEIISGTRRYRAAIIAGLKTVPAIIMKAGDKQCAKLSLMENIHREDLSLFEEAEAYFNLSSYHGVKKDKIEDELCVKKEEISDKIKFLRLESSMRYKIEENKITKNAARELLKIHDVEKQNEAAETIIKENLNDKEAASLVKEINRELALNKKNSPKMNFTLCANTVKKTVNILKENGQKAELLQKDSEKYMEFIIKIRKTGIL
ncbi:MAG: ParB/RepB/Spo0J family partition protein [Ruminococcaceae bacterium]|nr:ParB/RepB/Spo0J family partition protein [Oscillospiraceae bacterium]